MNDNQLQKRVPSSVKERGQYLIAFGVVASMLWVANFPIFVIFFFGIFAYFLLRMFSSGSRSETREIFEFYLTANEILRDDERRWYGFELNEAIKRGEEIVHRMSAAPPLVYFALGALHNKNGNHKAAVSNLAHVVENPSSNELAYVYPTPELRSYVKVLRKIEREPADAPLTSAAVRALERARKIRGNILLEESRKKFAEMPAPAEPQKALPQPEQKKQTPPAGLKSVVDSNGEAAEPAQEKQQGQSGNGRNGRSKKSARQNEEPFADRKPISEVLHDIYDKNVQ
ncbi:MAG TPA: hypothetical protein VFZ23_06320 [Pyrinomonadaceae bacterium]